MKPTELRKEFLKEFRELLKKYGAFISAEDHWQGYPECGEDVRMEVEFDNWEIESINLGRYADKEFKEENK